MEDQLPKEKEILKEVFTKGTTGIKIYAEPGSVVNVIIKTSGEA